MAESTRESDQATAVLVLGMHRSGTSALSRALNLRGLDIASRLVPASENNRTGFWESEELVALQDELLGQFGQRWYDFLPLPETWWQTAPAEAFRQRLLDYLERDFGQSRLFLIKDPRLCRLLPLWRAVLADFGARVRVVLMLRDPWEVAASLAARKGMSLPTAHGLQLWLRYSLEAERHSRGLPRCLVTYDELLADWPATLKRIARQVDLSWPCDDLESQRMIDEFLSVRHRHQRVGAERPGDGCSASIQQAHDALTGLASDPDAVDHRQVLDELLARTDAAMAAIAPLLAGYEQRYQESDRCYRHEQEVRRELARQLTVSRDEIRQMEFHHQQTVDRLKEQQLQQRRALEERITDLRQSLNQSRRDVEAGKGERKKLELELQAMVGSQSWKVTAPLRSCGDWLLGLRRGRFSSLARLGLNLKELECYRHLLDSGIFDRTHYLDSYPDVREAGLNPLVHFIRKGTAEGYLPNPLFETEWYLETYPDVAESGINPLLHYFIHGVTEGRNPSPYFDTLDYLERHPELRKSGVNPLAHCLAHEDVAAYLLVKKSAASESVEKPGPQPAARASGMQRPRPLFHDFSSYERNSLFILKLEAPFSEEAKRVIGHMSGVRRHLARHYADMPETALVSIIMPTYQRSACIGTAVRSALTQTYRNFELIVIDDGGEDDTAAVLAAFADLRIRYFRLERNSGAAAARNYGLKQARGEYVTYLDSDNTMEPDFLRILLGELLVENNAFDMAYCAQNIMVGDAGSGTARLEAVRYASFCRPVIENRNYIDLGALLHRRTLIERFGGFNERMQRLIDWEFLLRLSEQQYPKPVPCILSSYYHDVANNQITKLKSWRRALAHLDGYLAERGVADQLPGHAIPGLDSMYSLRFSPTPRRTRKVSIIIPSFECLDYLRLCIESVNRFTNVPFELIIVDNASARSVRDFLADLDRRDGVTVIQNEENYGFTYAVNQGIARADPDGDVILLNNDAVVTEGWAGALQQVFDDLPEVGLVIPRQVLPPHTPTIEIHNPISNVRREMDVNLSVHHDNILNTRPHDNSNGFFELSFAPFFCVYIPRHTLEAIGPLDFENAPHYRSDRLYCEAVRQIAGRKIIYTPHAKVYHFLQRATSTLREADAGSFDGMFVRNDWLEVKKRIANAD
ncbi:MAG: glycosyltransferase [Candidatus Competibacteraceae bacterium]|nr:MAG: glycosyltransferase [Candidatus Competibacteraceae bacterium]